MLNKTTISTRVSAIVSFCVLLYACSKKESNPAPTDPCAGKTIAITTTPDDAVTCNDNGKISVSVTGSTGFTYKLNSSGTYQSSSTFENLKAGSYTIFVKDGAGCEKSAAVTVASGGTAGAQFTAVKDLINAKCVSCHNATVTNGGKNWAIDCNIVDGKNDIKNRAVDLGTMPPTGPLTSSEKDIISAWITGGGGFTN